MTAQNDRALAATVSTSQRSYRAIVGRGVLEHVGHEMKTAGLSGRAFIIADQALFPVGVRRAQEALEVGGFAANVLTVPSGEQTKSLDTARKIYEWLAGQHAERRDAVVALGGGVTGDLAGFVAATWLRGVPFVQLPTSLAAMVDASIGGKVAVNLPTAKNMVGAFHQPRLVLAEIEYLMTLSRRELSAGWAEAIKHGLILDSSLLYTFESHQRELMALAGEITAQTIRRSVAIKARIVSEDEFETGDTRVLLNYGHTIGHALEALSGYGKFLHGEAVSIGMMAAAHISQSPGMISTELVERQRAVLVSYGLPVTMSNVPADAIISAARSDKKASSGTIRWVLLTGPGRAITRSDVPEAIVREALAKVTS